VEISERLLVAEPLSLRHEPLDQRQHAVGAIDEARQRRAAVGAGAILAAFVQPALGAVGGIDRRQPAEGQQVGGLEMRALLLELRAPLHLDQRRGGIREARTRMRLAGMRCASTKMAQPDPSRPSAPFRREVVETSSAAVALSRSGPRKRAVRWKLPSLLATTPGATSAAQGRSRQGLEASCDTRRGSASHPQQPRWAG